MKTQRVRISEDQFTDFAIWCRDYGQTLFKPMDPITNSVDVVNAGWDSAFQKSRDLGMNFRSKKTLKLRVKCWYRKLKTYHRTGNSRDLSEPEKILYNLWFTNIIYQ